MSEEKHISFSKKIVVDENHLDHLNHVNNITYLQWVQEISNEHWNLLANQTLRKKYIWMALRHEIDYKHQSFLDDEIIIKTWISNSQGVKSTRIVEIYANNKLSTRCKTTWLLLDAKTLKPKRIGKDILQIFEINK